MYNITARRMMSELLRKPLNAFGLLILRRYEPALPRSMQFFLTKPRHIELLPENRTVTQATI